MISVQQAEEIIRACQKDYGTTSVPLMQSPGRVLAEAVTADRDLPPFNRVSMDGIAIRFDDYEKGVLAYKIAGIIGAGEEAEAPLAENTCFEIMTGAALPAGADTIIQYEHLDISAGVARIMPDKTVLRGQNIHPQGIDKKQDEVLIPTGRIIGAPEINVAASVGKTDLLVRALPRVAVFSSGNELVDIADTPLPYQIRRSNNYALHAMLAPYGIAATLLHLPDNPEIVRQEIQKAMNSFDVLILSGGISMGKFDYIPQALETAGVTRHFHKVKQKPGKPFWFGSFGEKGVVFALPGNPVSSFLCMLRYALPWLEASLGFPEKQPVYAVLDENLRFEPALQYFLQANLRRDKDAVLRVTPLSHNGSGDHASLLEANAFIELPENQTAFAAGEIFRVWEYR